jgi:16S rRNA processing protein RimM
MRKKRSVRAILERRKRRFFDHSNEVMIGKIVGVHGPVSYTHLTLPTIA